MYDMFDFPFTLPFIYDNNGGTNFLSSEVKNHLKHNRQTDLQNN